MWWWWSILSQFDDCRVQHVHARFAKLTIINWNAIYVGCHIHCTLTIIFFNIVYLLGIIKGLDRNWVGLNPRVEKWRSEGAIHGVVSNDGLFALFQDGRIIRPLCCYCLQVVQIVLESSRLLQRWGLLDSCAMLLTQHKSVIGFIITSVGSNSLHLLQKVR